MAHAGVPHIWPLARALELAEEVHRVLRDEHADVSRQHFFSHMYGNEPNRWADELQGMSRLKLITNYFTRMRLIQPDGTLDFLHKGALADAPAEWTPWYELARPQSEVGQLVFGHWAALDGTTTQSHLHAIDTGCVYGRSLTALRLEDRKRFGVAGS